MPIRDIGRSVAVGLDLHLKIIRTYHAHDLVDDGLRWAVHADVRMDLELELRERKLFKLRKDALRDLQRDQCLADHPVAERVELAKLEAAVEIAAAVADAVYHDGIHKIRVLTGEELGIGADRHSIFTHQIGPHERDDLLDHLRHRKFHSERADERIWHYLEYTLSGCLMSII